MRIAVVEDDDGVGAALVDALAAFGHQPIQMRRGADILLRHRDVDAVLLDLGLPDLDGLDVLRRLRTVSEVPVVVLTARGDERSVVRALRDGADDYVVKPARFGELAARLDTAGRRHHAVQKSGGSVEVGPIVVDLDARRVTVAGEDIDLTRKEYDLLAELAQRRGEAVRREQLMDTIWGDAHVAVSRSIDVHMTALRAKLGPDNGIQTIRGYGFRWG